MKNELRTIGFVFLLFACAASPAAAQDAPGFKLKNRSTFSNAGREHDPFWPIGWVRPVASPTATTGADPAVPVVREVEFSTTGFVLTSILMGQPALAVINGREYAEGEVIPCQMQGQKIEIQLAAVQDGSVVLRYHDKNYTVLIQRKGEEQKQIARTEETQLPEGLR